MSSGLNEFCKQMMSKNAPLQLSVDSPVIGRFYARSCQQQQLQNGDFYVQFSGLGYAFTNISKKLSFTMAGSVQYAQDFQVSEDCDIYAYFRSSKIQSSDFRINKIEQPFASFLNTLSPMGENFGRQLVGGKLSEGFTVIRDKNGADDFSIGILDLGKKPFHPFDVHGTGRVTVENMRTEIHENQRDFIGPIEITEAGRALYLTGTVDGAPAIDLMVMGKNEGDAAIQLYVDYPMVGPLPAPPVLSSPVNAGNFQKTIPLAPGQYYVVLDNSASAGTVNPPGNPMDDRAAVVNYVVQIGDAP